MENNVLSKNRIIGKIRKKFFNFAIRKLEKNFTSSAPQFPPGLSARRGVGKGLRCSRRRRKEGEERNKKMIKKYFRDRRSIRKFSPKPVEDNLLREILEAATKAPTTGNLQLYSIVVSRGKEIKEKLAPLHFNQPATGAPVILTICADLERYTRWCDLSSTDAGSDNLLTFLSAFADAIIYAQQIVTIAEQENLGTCYLGTVTYNAPEIAKALGLPARTIPVACVALGWPDEEGQETERLPLEGVMHEETYKEATDEEIIEIYKAKEEFAPNKKFVEENGKENLAQVMAEVRYPRSMNEEYSEKLLAYLKNIGILKDGTGN